MSGAAAISPRPRAGETEGWLHRTLAQCGESHFTVVQGRRIHFLEWGNERRDKPTLVLVHGFRGNAHWWDAVAPHLTSNFRVLAPDLAGMGDTAHHDCYAGHVFVEDLLGTIERECHAPVTVIAHSFGGALSLAACTARPKLFARAIIIDSYFLFEGDEPPREPAIRGGHVYPDLASAMSRFRLLPEQPVAIPALVEHLARHSLRAVDGGWCWKFDPRLTPETWLRTNNEQLLQSVPVPVDYLYGEHSDVVSAKRAQHIVAALSRARGPIVIPDAHHHVMIDQPLALVAVLRALLA